MALIFFEGTMASNTDAADINEIMMAYYLAGKKWSVIHDFKEVEKQLAIKKSKVDVELIVQKTMQAEIQAKEVLSWANTNGYKSKVKKVFWTARPGVLARAVNKEVDSRKNPTDVLIQFTDGKFLGISAKATKTKGDIGFKNPGVGTIDSSLRINLKKLLDDEEDIVVKKLKLPESKNLRKSFIRSNLTIQTKTKEFGSKILEKIRDEFFKKIKKLSQKELREYLIKDWLDASNGNYPPYIKVTGMGKKPPYSAKIEDPLKNDKLTNLMSAKKIIVEKVGRDSIGVIADGKKILKMRAKYESEKIASSLKFSGDPWK